MSRQHVNHKQGRWSLFYLFIVIGTLFFLLGLGLSVLSRFEHEHTATRRCLIFAFIIPPIFIALAFLPLPWLTYAGYIVIGGAIAVGLALFIPTGQPSGFPDDSPVTQLDERTIMFSRALMAPGSVRFKEYYQEFPEHQGPDDRFRLRPGLMSKEAALYEPLSFAAAGASFATVGLLAALVEGDPADVQQAVDSVQATAFIKGWSKKLGGISCGVTKLKDYHLYTTKGRGPEYGQRIDLNHKYAIAITVEMDHRNLGSAPEGPALMESAQQYLNVGAICTQIAEVIRQLGWPAEAHIDGHYKVVCPLVAKDAGLGELGRMGLLMTPELGPRVRIGVVTTDMPLVIDRRFHDPSVLHFCTICSKCAEVCPAGAISRENRGQIDGVHRWKIDSESCFTLWCTVGTDCGKCMRACPYSHPNNLMHNVVRWGLRNSVVFRHFALKMDDLLYGRRPAQLPLAQWIPPRSPKKQLPVDWP